MTSTITVLQAKSHSLSSQFLEAQCDSFIAKCTHSTFKM